jgi:AmmeMemoRadiSam system protein B
MSIKSGGSLPCPTKPLGKSGNVRRFGFVSKKRCLGYLTLFIMCLVVPLSAMCAQNGGKEKMGKKTNRIVRKTFGDGRWFPGNGKALAATVNGYIENAKTDDLDGRIIAAIAPHAGYSYSGKVAGYAFRAIKDNAGRGHHPETVLVFGISHRGGGKGVAIMDGDAIETSLGEVELDREAAELLVSESPRISFNYAPHAGEHSAENEIPFVQEALPNTKIVVGLIGDHDRETVDELVRALGVLSKKKKILVIASSDMLHDPDYSLVTRIDGETLKKVKTMDWDTIREEWRPSKQIFCGIMPVLAAMQFAKSQGCQKGIVLNYRNSGDDFPDSRGQWVVGYASVVFVVPE